VHRRHDDDVDLARTSHDEVARTHSTNIRLIDGARTRATHRQAPDRRDLERTIEMKRIDTDKFFGAADAT